MDRAGSDNREGELLYREVTERFWILRLVVEIYPDRLTVRLSPLHRSPRRIPFAGITSVRTTTYSPATYGGWYWGLRRSFGGDTVYRLRGKRGVELVREDDTRIFVGSQNPTELAVAIERARGRERTDQTS